MASSQLHVPPPLLLLLLIICLGSSSSTLDDDVTKWLSWNVGKYHQKASLQAQSVIDWKLRRAETKRVEKRVIQDGTGDYTSITEALNSIPLFNTGRVLLLIGPGVYREKIQVPVALPFVTFLGDPANLPTITGNDTASVLGRGGKPLKTFQSATVAIDASYFVAANIKFENTAPHEVGSIGGQAVALRISGTKAAFYNCSFIGAQDTLYDHKGLHYFHNCFIQGSVDFIFGYGRSLYENCYLNSVAKKVASLTAQKRTNASIESGFSFKNSTVSGSGLVYLGRAWGDYSRVIFSYSFMDKIVLPQGWSDWGDQKRDSRVFYGEYKCSGPGANMTGRVPWAKMLTDEEAQPFLGTYFVGGDTWIVSP